MSTNQKKIPQLSKNLEELVIKNTENDKRSILHQRLKQAFIPGEGYEYIYVLDYDDNFVYFETYDYDFGAYLTWRVSYTYNGTNANFGEDVTEVVRKTSYEEVEYEEMSEKSILKALTKFFKKFEDKTGTPVIKQFIEEEMIAVEPLYILPGEVDGQGYTIDLEVTKQMVESLNKALAEGSLETNFFHKHKTQSFSVIKAWVNECDCYIGETFVPEGQPIVKTKFHSKEAWALRKSGELMGVSIEGTGSFVEVDVDE